MSFLALVASHVVVTLLGAISGWFLKVLHSWLGDDKIKKQEQDSVQPLKDAKTGAEIDKATDSSLDHF